MASVRNFGELYELLARGTVWVAHLKPEPIRATPLPERTDAELEILDLLCEGPRTNVAMATRIRRTRAAVWHITERFVERGWVTRENIGDEANPEILYTITLAGRRAATEPCKPPREAFSDARDRGRKRLPRPTYTPPPQVEAIEPPNHNQYIKTIARWIRLTDLPEESGPCETTGGVTIPPRHSSRPAKTNRPSWKALDLDNDPRVPEALQMRDDGRTVTEICEALQMHHSSLKKILAARKEG